MSIDLTNAKLITLAMGSRSVPGPKKPNPHTLFRWHKYGKMVDGERVHLETVLVNNRLYTTEESVVTFCARTCQPPRHKGTPSPTRAKRFLDNAGVTTGRKRATKAQRPSTKSKAKR